MRLVDGRGRLGRVLADTEAAALAVRVAVSGLHAAADLLDRALDRAEHSADKRPMGLTVDARIAASRAAGLTDPADMVWAPSKEQM